MLTLVHYKTETGAAQHGAGLQHATLAENGSGQEHGPCFQHAAGTDLHAPAHVRMGAQS